jgi:hypothetical protein
LPGDCAFACRTQERLPRSVPMLSAVVSSQARLFAEALDFGDHAIQAFINASAMGAAMRHEPPRGKQAAMQTRPGHQVSVRCGSEINDRRLEIILHRMILGTGNRIRNRRDAGLDRLLIGKTAFPFDFHLHGHVLELLLAK